jgi:hypothetical protein
MFVYTGESYRNLETAVEIKPVVSGTRCQVFVRYPDLKDPLCITGAQANGVLEYVLRRRVGSTNDALEAIFKKVEEAQDLTTNGNHKRKPRVLRNPSLTSSRASLSAKIRWARQHGRPVEEIASLEEQRRNLSKV